MTAEPKAETRRTALLCAMPGRFAESLASELERIGLSVDRAPTQGDALRLLRRERRDVVIAAARPTDFACFLRGMLRSHDTIISQFIWNGAVYCAHPRTGQPGVLVEAVRQAGIGLSDRLLAAWTPQPTARTTMSASIYIVD